jgi:hypothetical protein
MAFPVQILALLLTEHAREPFAGPVLIYGRQTVNCSFDDALWMFESLGIRPHLDGMSHPPPGAALDFARLVTLLGLGDATIFEADLNLPVAGELTGRFGLIVDAGTMENVFDLRRGMMNTAEMLRPGGRVVHVSPVDNYLNAGFVQLSPTFYQDYYVENGFDEVHGLMVVRPRDGAASKRWNVFAYDHAALGGVNSMFCSDDTQLAVYFTARKTAASTSERVPLQSYFARLSETQDTASAQYVLSYDPAAAKVTRVHDPASAAAKLALFTPVFTLDLAARG